MTATNRTILATVLLAVASAVLSAFVSYSSRITALETQQANDTARIERIEQKIDRLFEFLTGRKP